MKGKQPALTWVVEQRWHRDKGKPCFGLVLNAAKRALSALALLRARTPWPALLAIGMVNAEAEAWFSPAGQPALRHATLYAKRLAVPAAASLPPIKQR